MAFEHAMEAAAILTKNDIFSRKEVLEALSQVTFEDSMAKFASMKNVRHRFNMVESNIHDY